MQPTTSTFACEADGIYRFNAEGSPERVCPPIIVVGSSDDDNPTRPMGKLIRLAWTDHADHPWQEASVPSPIVADAERLAAYLAKRGWLPEGDGWHDFICHAAIQHLGFTAMRPATVPLATAG